MNRRAILLTAAVAAACAIVLGVSALWPRREAATGPTYTVQRVEAMLRASPGALAGRTIRVRALRLYDCPRMQGGATHVWYTCDFIPASLAPALHRPGTVRLPTPLDLWTDPPSDTRRFLHGLPVVGGLFPFESWDNDFDPKVYLVRLVPSPTCYSPDPTAPCPRAQYLGPA